jgi:hypothetical protein
MFNTWLSLVADLAVLLAAQAELAVAAELEVI